MIKRIKNLINSTNTEDILIGMELMYHYLSIDEIKSIVGYISTPRTFNGIAFKIGNSEHVVFCGYSLYISGLNWEEERYQKSNNVTYLGEHKEYEIQNKKLVEESKKSS